MTLVEPRRDAAAEPEDDGKFLPTFDPEPMAAGPGMSTAEEAEARLDDHRLRRMVPTLRQGDGEESGDVFGQLRADREAAVEPKVRLGQRAFGYVRDIDPRRIDGPKLPLIVFALTTILGGFERTVISSLGPEIRSDLGLSLKTQSTILSFVTALGYVIGVPIAYLVDRTRRTRLLRFAAITNGLSLLGRAFAPSAAPYVAAQVTYALSGDAEGPAQPPLIADYYPSRSRARVFAFLSAAGIAGTLVLTPIVSITDRFGWREALLVLAAVAVPAVVLTFLLREPVRGGVDRLEMGVSRSDAADEPPPPSFGEAIRAAWAIRSVRRIAYVALIGVLSQPLTLLVVQVEAERFLLTPGQRITISTITSLVSFPAVLFSGAFADRLLRRRPGQLMAVWAGFFLFQGVGLVAQALIPSLSLFISLDVVTSVVIAMVLPATATILTLATPARIRGVSLQVPVPFQLIGLVIGPILVGYAQTMDLAASLILFAPFYAIAAAILLSTSVSVDRDIRAARAASVADQVVRRAREEGLSKMLVIRDLDVTYDGVQILFNVDLDVEEGESLALLGTNGAGKSTLLRAIAGVHEAENGAIFIDGQDITHVPSHENAARGIVYMPGGQAVFPSLTVRENLATAGYLRSRKPMDGEDYSLDAEINWCLELFPALGERMSVAAGTLSGGEQQMLALSQAFLMKPRVLMIDELSLGLAPPVVEKLLGVLRDLRRAGTTIILVEQSLNIALTVAERAVFMENGEIRFDGPTDDLLARPDLVRSVFMGGAVAGRTGTPYRRIRATIEGEQAEPLLVVEDLTLSYGGICALSGVSFSVEVGETVGVIGPNGAGKTTLFDAVSGFASGVDGRVVLEGKDVSRMTPDARARLGMGRAFQSAKLFPPLTVRENIAVALERRASKSALMAALWLPPLRESERKLNARIDGFIELLGLGAFADKFVRELSTGSRRAVEVACIMAAEPKLLLLDEPSSGLSQAEAEALGPALSRIVRETGCGMLLIEHDLRLLTSVSDRLVGMVLGEVVATGTAEEVTNHHAILAAYMTASDAVLERSGSRFASAHPDRISHPDPWSPNAPDTEDHLT